ncbi:MAG TPA: NUDIX hydrolase [Bacillota bacterium]|nr:NUDIX hydrolase [Bacillota bacterium]
MRDLTEKTLKTTTVYNGKIVHLRVDDVLLPDGEKSKREIIKHPGAVAIIPITPDNKIVLVRQYRKPLEKTIVEIPAGKIEQKERPELTAIRELEEETGYTTNELSFVTSFYTSPGFADELMHIYMTTDIHRLTEKVTGDDDEFIEKMELTLEEAKEYVRKQDIHDAKTNYAILYLEQMEMNR